MHLFRRIRQGLLSQNRFSKYLLYAIGEIILVMIGILLALQVNNWNEGRMKLELEKEFLIGLKQDLNQDIIQAKELINERKIKLNIIKLLEPNFVLDPQYRMQSIDTISQDFSGLFRRESSFRSTDGTYKALIADGKTSLISNKVLFQQIQGIYDISYPRIYSIYDNFKERESNLTSKYAYEKFNWNYNILMRTENRRIISDVANFHEAGQFYNVFLDRAIVEIQKVIDEINLELDK